MKPITLTDHHNTPYLTIQPRDDNVIYKEWRGANLQEDKIITGYQKSLEHASLNQYNYIINDKRKVSGTWDQPLEWIVSTYFPAIAHEGIEKLALIEPWEIFSRLSSTLFYHKAKNFVDIKLFKTYEEAYQWVEGHNK